MKGALWNEAYCSEFGTPPVSFKGRVLEGEVDEFFSEFPELCPAEWRSRREQRDGLRKVIDNIKKERTYNKLNMTWRGGWGAVDRPATRNAGDVKRLRMPVDGLNFEGLPEGYSLSPIIFMAAYKALAPESDDMMELCRYLTEFEWAELGAVSDYAKKNPACRASSYWLVDFKEGMGHMTEPNPPFDWDAAFEEMRNPPIQLDRDLIEYKIPGIFEEIFHYRGKKREGAPKFRDYLSQGLWATAGSAKHERLEIDGKRSRISKNVFAEMIEVDDMLRRLEAKRFFEFGVFVKAERTKRRLAVNGDVEANWTQGYLLYLIEPLLTQFHGYGAVGSVEEEKELFDGLLELVGQNWFCSFDWKSFDHQIPTWLLHAVLREIGSILLYVYPTCRGDIELCIAHTHYQLDHSWLVHGEQKKQIVNGLMSGIMLTSVFGTLCNLALSRIALGIAGMFSSDWDAVAKGDDLLCWSQDLTVLTKWYRGMLRLGVIAHPSKQVFGLRGEFLRTVIAHDGIHGWPNRTLASMVERKPWTEGDSEDDEIVAFLDAYTTTCRRGYVENNNFIGGVKLWMQRRGIPQKVLYIPRCTGGFGLEENILTKSVTWQRFTEPKWFYLPGVLTRNKMTKVTTRFGIASDGQAFSRAVQAVVKRKIPERKISETATINNLPVATFDPARVGVDVPDKLAMGMAVSPGDWILLKALYRETHLKQIKRLLRISDEGRFGLALAKDWVEGHFYETCTYHNPFWLSTRRAWWVRLTVRWKDAHGAASQSQYWSDMGHCARWVDAHLDVQLASDKYEGK